MRGAFLVTPSASHDLEDILDYVRENSGPNRALHVYERLLDAFRKIGARPNVGHIRHDLADESLRVMNVYSYVIVYRPETKPVQILRVVHGARDVPHALREEIQD